MPWAKDRGGRSFKTGVPASLINPEPPPAGTLTPDSGPNGTAFSIAWDDAWGDLDQGVLGSISIGGHETWSYNQNGMASGTYPPQSVTLAQDQWNIPALPPGPAAVKAHMSDGTTVHDFGTFTIT